MKNLLANFQKSNFKYLNVDEEDDSSVLFTKEDGVSLVPDEKSSFYRDPSGKRNLSNAVFMYTELEGDFIVRSHVDHDFIYTGDAASIMMRVDDDHWAKIGFEKSETGTNSLISSITYGGWSDRAIGETYSWDNVRLYLVRKGNTFGMYYSADDKHKRLIRYFHFDAPEKIQVGMMAQSPNGEGDAVMNFYTFEVEHISVESIEEGALDDYR
jgi:regulation of enolase protein 1 (concanavalin A-like superfamily)